MPCSRSTMASTSSWLIRARWKMAHHRRAQGAYSPSSGERENAGRAGGHWFALWMTVTAPHWPSAITSIRHALAVVGRHGVGEDAQDLAQ